MNRRFQALNCFIAFAMFAALSNHAAALTRHKPAPQPKKAEGVVAVTKGETENKFGVNSGSSAYTAEDQIAADRLRADLIEKYPDVTKQQKNRGQWPNNALYHAETTLLLRLANKNGGSLAGRELVIHTDRKMCPSCKELLPYIGLELGNPTVTFIDHRGRRLKCAMASR